jgi:hypothetical protein
MRRVMLAMKSATLAIAMRNSWQRSLLLLGLVLLLASQQALAADHFLSIGGGDSPSYTQVSLEKNVLFYQRLLGELEGPRVEHDIYFADGMAGSRDVQYVASSEVPRVNLLLARLFNQEEGVNLRYRPHQIPNLRGASSRKSLENWFDTTGSRLRDGDRLFIYFTGHGGPGNPPRNTTISLWNERAMSVGEFTFLLDKISPGVKVVLIMVQCHSGGFADVIFPGGRAGPRLATARRCGFFATVPERNAAGCTADISEEDYHDYSTYFFAALGGKTRTGQAVPSGDYDRDGRVSLAEAHAYTVINSETIDIPLATSDVLLRQFSRLRGNGLMGVESPMESLLEHASPTQRVIVEGLARELNLRADSEVTSARQLAERTNNDKKDSEKQRTQRWTEADNIAKGITRRLTRRWPELSSPWNPQVPQLLKEQGDDIRRAIESDRSYPRFGRAYDQFQAATDKDLSLEHQWAKTQRFLYTVESVALAANLEQVAAPQIVARYRQMLGDEAGTLPQVPPASSEGHQ